MAGVDRAKASAQLRASGCRKRPALCRPAATARQPASHHGARRRPASQVRNAQRARVAHRTAGPTAKAEQTVTRLQGRAPEREDLRAAALLAARATATGVSRTDSAFTFNIAVRRRRAARDAVSSWAGLPAAIGEVCGVRD